MTTIGVSGIPASVRKPSKRHLSLVARTGYAARGVIYLIVGGLAALAAFGGGGETTDSRGALTELLNAPFGTILLVVVAIGLLCYSAWRATQAVMDTDDHGTDLKGLLIRGGLAVSAITHVALAFFSLSMAFGPGGGGSSPGSNQGSNQGSSQEWTAWLLSQPFGQWLVALVGAAVVGAGIAHFIKAWTADFERHFDMDAQEREFITPISRFGLFARGVAFLLIGGFFVVAAWQQDPGEARGLSGALQTLQQQPYGWALLGLLAVGLVAFGAYSLLESRYRKVTIPG